MYRWNDNTIKMYFDKEMQNALNDFSNEELERLDLSKLSRQTKSKRIYHMICLSYTIGKLKEIREASKEGTTTLLRIEMRYAKKDFNDKELEMSDISELLHKTKSKRIIHMISLAYTLGRLNGIRSLDEMKTPIGLR